MRRGDDGERRRGLRRGGERRSASRRTEHVTGDRRRAARRRRGDAREVTGQPQELFAVETGGELCEQVAPIIGDRELALEESGAAAHRPGSTWFRNPLFSR